MKKDDFKVYSNPNIKKRMMEEEVEFELEIPDEESIAMLFISSPYFITLMRGQDMFYYPTDLSADESLIAPLFNREVLLDIVESSKLVRMNEEVPLPVLLHIPLEDEDGDKKMVSLFEGIMQVEFMKFFQTVVMVTNPEAGLAEEFDDVFENLVGDLEENGYLDQALANIAAYMDNPDLLAELLFPEDEEE